MIRIAAFILCSFVLTAPLMAEVFSKPEDAVAAYITAVKTGSGAHIKMAFAEDARIQYYDHRGDYYNSTRAQFADLVDSGGDWDAKIEITNMLLTGKVANATVEFTWGPNGEYGYVDYLNLIHDGDSWHISNKVAMFITR